MKKSSGPLRAAMILTLVALAVVAVLALAACGGSSTTDQNIPEAAASTDDISAWSDALGTNGLTDKLNEAGPFVVFASSNDAVTAAGAGALTADVQQAMIIPAADSKVPTGDELKAGFSGSSMLDGNSVVTYTGNDGQFYMNAMKVVSGPVETKNGVIYVGRGSRHPEVRN